MQFPVRVIREIQYSPQYWHTGSKNADNRFMAKTQAHTLYKEVLSSILTLHALSEFILKLLTRVLIILGRKILKYFETTKGG